MTASFAASEPSKCIWLIGGTQESAQLAEALVAAQLPCITTVTTETARSLYPPAPTLQVWVGKLSCDELPTFLATYKICAILDASHPFAIEVSQLAIATSQQHQVPYLRFERPTCSDRQGETTANRIIHTSFAGLLTDNVLDGERVLLTVGYRSLALFQPWHDRALLFARILPSVIALEAALAAGFTPDRLIAIRPPISVELEQALWQQWQISTVVTKASGTAGGEDVKRQVATQLGIRLIVIERPAIDYPQQTSDVQMALAFCQAALDPFPA